MRAEEPSGQAVPEPEGDLSARLLERWQRDGDPDALDELLRIEVDLLRGRIRRRGGNLLSPSLSSTDVAQEAVLGLIRVREPPSFEAPAALRAYLWRSAWRLLGAHFQRTGRRPARLDPASSQVAATAFATSGGLAEVEADDRAMALDLALNLLEPQAREILDRVYFRQMGVEAAARELGITEEAAKKRLARARRKLAEKLGDWSELVG